MIDRRHHSSNQVISLLAYLLAVVLLIPATGLLAASPHKPNIVFILADDLNWSDLGCYGHLYHQTPHLDRLARESMRA